MPVLLCPKCECNDIEKTGSRKHWGNVVDAWACNYCGHAWTSEPEKQTGEAVLSVMQFHVLRCPNCSSANVIVQRKMPDGTRYQLCQNCGKTFKTVYV
jgi:transposase-like protein